MKELKSAHIFFTDGDTIIYPSIEKIEATDSFVAYVFDSGAGVMIPFSSIKYIYYGKGFKSDK